MKTIPVLSPFRLSTLTPWLSGFLPLPFRRRKRGTGFDNPAPRFRPLHFNGKTVCTGAAAVGRFCGGSAPAPPASPKEQDKGKCGTGGRRDERQDCFIGVRPCLKMFQFLVSNFPQYKYQHQNHLKYQVLHGKYKFYSPLPARANYILTALHC